MRKTTNKRTRKKQRKRERMRRRKRNRKRKKKRKRRRKRKRMRQQGPFLHAPWFPQTTLLGPPGLHFESRGVHFGNPGPPRTQKKPKGTPRRKRETSRIVIWGILGSPWGPLWDHVGDFF